VAAADRLRDQDWCILLLVSEHTRTANPYQLIYDALDISEPVEPAHKTHMLRRRGPAARRMLTWRPASKPAWLNSRALQRGAAKTYRR
jgi:hypothetical protein